MHAVVCEPDLHRRYRDCSGDCPRCVGATRLQSRRRNHSGLTPAALVHVRLCIAKIAVSSASDLRATRSRGGEPRASSEWRIQERRASLAVVRDNRAGVGMRLPTINARRGVRTGSAKALPRLFGRLPPVCWGTLLQSRPRSHAGLTPAALAPRDACVRTYAESLLRACLPGTLPDNRGSVVARAFPDPHAGLTPAALVHVRLCIARIAVSSASDLRAT